jgi:hypothetical protein
MAKFFSELTPFLQEFIAQQKMYFVASAADEGRINLSPKGLDSFRILGPNRVAWLNLTGSGNETAAHLLKANRITVMFNSFDEKPLILRLYGTAKTIHPRDAEWHDLIPLFPTKRGSRQIIEMQVESAQTSCGWGVPKMDYVSERHQLDKWASEKSDEKISEYWDEKNTESIDGFPTGIFGDEE